MPDTSTLPAAEGGRANGEGKTNWPLMIGIGGAGLILLITLLKKGGSTTGTTAAGTSINAALGSIQEQNLNIMGQVGQSEANLSNQIGTSQAALSNQIGTSDAALTKELGTVNNNVVVGAQGTQAGLLGLQQSLASSTSWTAANIGSAVQAVTGTPFAQEQKLAQIAQSTNQANAASSYMQQLQHDIDLLLQNQIPNQSTV